MARRARRHLRLVYSSTRRPEQAREVAQIEAAILAYVQREQIRVLKEAAQEVTERLAPIDPMEAKAFLAELMRGDLP